MIYVVKKNSINVENLKLDNLKSHYLSKPQLPQKSKQIRIYGSSVFFKYKENGLQPEISVQHSFRIQGGYNEQDQHKKDRVPVNLAPSIGRQNSKQESIILVDFS